MLFKLNLLPIDLLKLTLQKLLNVLFIEDFYGFIIFDSKLKGTTFLKYFSKLQYLLTTYG